MRDHRDARRAPEVPSAWAGIALRIPIAEELGLVGPSNHGMKLTPGRSCYAHLYGCSLRFLVERSMLPALPEAAYP